NTESRVKNMRRLLRRLSSGWASLTSWITGAEPEPISLDPSSLERIVSSSVMTPEFLDSLEHQCLLNLSAALTYSNTSNQIVSTQCWMTWNDLPRPRFSSPYILGLQ